MAARYASASSRPLLLAAELPGTVTISIARASFSCRSCPRSRLALALILGLIALDVVVGIAWSLILLSGRCAHTRIHVGAITLLLAALRLAARPAGEMTYDLKRAEILSTLVNGATWLTLGLFIVYKRIRRLIAPPTPAGAAVLILPLVAPLRSGVAATGMLSVRRPRPCRLAGASGPYRGTG